jgi:hypothetical protein
MKFIYIISSFLLAASLQSAETGTEYVSLEVTPAIALGDTVRVVVRDDRGLETAAIDALVVDLFALDESSEPIATLRVAAGATSDSIIIPEAGVPLSLPLLRGRIRAGDTGEYAGEILATLAAPAAVN